MLRRAIVAMVLLMLKTPAAKAEEVFALPGRAAEPALLVRHEPGPGPIVLLVHGATFPSGLAFAYRLNGRSWMDDLRARGFDVWAFDFAGYGGSARPLSMDDPSAPLVGRTDEAAMQIERVVVHARKAAPGRPLFIVAHSWATMPAGAFAGQRPELVDRLVLFGPPAPRSLPASDDRVLGPVIFSTADDQWGAFQAGIPDGEPAPILRRNFDRWMANYLATDADSARRTPPAVRIPAGPAADLADRNRGRFPYDPATVRTPTLIVRGEWDPVTRDADAAWLIKALANVPGGARDLKLPRGGHRMHLETNRQVLFDAVGAYLGQPR